MTQLRILCLGAGDGWHSDQLSDASAEAGCSIAFATYESLQTVMINDEPSHECEAGNLGNFDVLLTRTMPVGSLEQITFKGVRIFTL